MIRKYTREELSGMIFDWICRYRFSKGKTTDFLDISKTFMQFEKYAGYKAQSCNDVYQTMINLGWVKK